MAASDAAVFRVAGIVPATMMFAWSGILIPRPFSFVPAFLHSLLTCRSLVRFHCFSMRLSYAPINLVNLIETIVRWCT